MQSKDSKFFLLLLTIATLHAYNEARIPIISVDLKPPDNEASDVIIEKIRPAIELDFNDVLKTYETKRESILEEEEFLLNGGHLQLTPKEQKVHLIFMRHKLNELTHGFEYPAENSAALHFFNAKPMIDKSEVFKFIQDMPKGAILHIHNTAAVSSEWVIANLTYQPGLLSCLNKDGVTILTFRRELEKHKCRRPYFEIAHERERVKSVRGFDWLLERRINLYTRLPEVEYNTIDKVWTRFQTIFHTMNDLLKYLPAFKAFHWRMLEELYEDNVMYAEVRMRFKELYDEKGAKISSEESIEELLKIVKEFKASHPGFLGIKVIYATNRDIKQDELVPVFETFKKLHALHPDFIIGFDLVGQEDKGKPLHTFVEALQNLPSTAKYFFHAGETNWYGSSTDLNLVDAILMNTTRIGHGFGLLKHPVLRRFVKDRVIAIEVNPLSNQILNLVADLRNHPGGFFMAEDMPMVITNDSPGFWDAKGLSYDMYYAIMSLAPNTAGLKTLKNIVWSSILYSAMNEQEKENAFNTLSDQWEAFLDRILEQEGILD